jgi:hypothetical protein
MEINNTYKNSLLNLKNVKELLSILNYMTMPQYGSITFVIHDGNLVQIEKTEKHRLR